MNGAASKLRRQDGFTLVEIVITAAIGAIVMGALVSVILTSVRSTDVASSRVEASAQVRSFESFAYDDFASAQVQNGATCTVSNPCSSAIVVSATQVTNAQPPVASADVITYAWDQTSFVDRSAASTGVSRHVAANVTAFSWYLDQTTQFPTVVISITVTVSNYSESQTFRFYPRLNP